MDPAPKTSSHNFWPNASTTSRSATSDWNAAAQKPINDYLHDLVPERELERKVGRHRFPFFKLPREVRDEVYYNTWGSIVFSFDHGGMLVVVRHGNATIPDTLAIFPEWLQANVQFRDEGMQQLYRSAVFAVVGRSAISSMTLRIPSPHQWTIKAGAGTIIVTPEVIENHSGLLSLSKATRIQVRGDSATRRIHQNSCTFCTYERRAQSETFQVVSAVMGLTKNGGSAVRELEFRLTPPDFFTNSNHEYPELDVAQWDDSLFTKLPKTLNRIKISIYNYSCYTHHARSPAEKVKMQVQSECLKRVESLMKNGSTGKVVQGMESCDDEDYHKLQETWFCEAVFANYNTAVGR